MCARCMSKQHGESGRAVKVCKLPCRVHFQQGEPQGILNQRHLRKIRHPSPQIMQTSHRNGCAEACMSVALCFALITSAPKQQAAGSNKPMCGKGRSGHDSELNKYNSVILGLESRERRIFLCWM